LHTKSHSKDFDILSLVVLFAGSDNGNGQPLCFIRFGSPATSGARVFPQNFLDGPQFVLQCRLICAILQSANLENEGEIDKGAFAWGSIPSFENLRVIPAIGVCSLIARIGSELS
jgi:hypothetical protein